MSGIGVVTRMLALPAALCSLLSAPIAEAATINWGGSGAVAVPVPAAAAGYKTETFASTFTANTVDMGLTKAAGKQWYFFNFFGLSPVSSYATLSSNGITLSGVNGSEATNIATATLAPTSSGWRGTAFGGGAYIEATFSYNAAAVNMSTGWPAFWSMSMEHLIGSQSGEQWPGQQAWYAHFIEPDIFEADTTVSYSYGGNIHDWYGLWGSASCPNYCNYQLPWSSVVRNFPTGTNTNQFHRYGLLWVPATATKPGSYTYYFDGVQIGAKITYAKYTGQPPIPTASTPWTFGIVDQQHLVLILGSGPSAPMTVKSVQVWQASAASNLKY